MKIVRYRVERQNEVGAWIPHGMTRSNGAEVQEELWKERSRLPGKQFRLIEETIKTRVIDA